VSREYENTIVFFVAQSREPLGRDYRVRRSLALAGRLKKINRVFFLSPTHLKDEIEAAGETYIDADFDDIHTIARFLGDLSPDIAVFDVDEAPAALILLLRGLGSIIVGMGCRTDGPEDFDIGINPYLSSGAAKFEGLNYWVPDTSCLWNGPEFVDGEGAADPHASPDVVFNVTEPSSSRLPALVRLFDLLKQRGITSSVVACGSAGADTALEGLAISDPEAAQRAIKNAGLIVNVGLRRLFDLMSLSRPLALLALGQKESDLMGALLPEGGVFDLGVAHEEDPETIANRVERILGEPETLAHHAALSSSIVSGNNVDRVCEIINVAKLLPWDSDFFGFPVAFLSCLKLNSAIVKFVFNFCKRHSVSLLEYLCDCHDRESVLLAERTGFNFADIRLTFERFIDPRIQVPDLPPGFTFTLGEERDVGRLMEIADGLYLSSRYYFDLNFPRDKVQQFYQDWVRKAVFGTFDDQAFVLRRDGDPVGFCTVKYEPAACARIRLVGVDPRHKGWRLGPLLVAHTLRALAGEGVRYVQVVSQGRNYAAQRLYQRTGFVTKETELWYHRWFKEEVFHS